MPEYINSSDPLWDTLIVIKNKKASDEKLKKAKRDGNTVSKYKNKNGELINKNKKLDDITEGAKHNRISMEQSKIISKARCDKKLTQVQLANIINVKKEVINDYENGKAIINQQLLSKIKRALNIKTIKKK